MCSLRTQACMTASQMSDCQECLPVSMRALAANELGHAARCGGPRRGPGRSYGSAPGATPPVPACTSSDFSMYSCTTRSARLSGCVQDARARGRAGMRPARARHLCSRSRGRVVPGWQGARARNDIVSLVGHWQARRGGHRAPASRCAPCQAVLTTGHNVPCMAGLRAGAVRGIRRPNMGAGDSPQRRAGAAYAALAAEQHLHGGVSKSAAGLQAHRGARQVPLDLAQQAPGVRPEILAAAGGAGELGCSALAERGALAERARLLRGGAAVSGPGFRMY